MAQRTAALGGPDALGDRGVLDLDVRTFGLIDAEAGQWASCLRVVHGPSMETTCRIEMEENEAVFSLAFTTFGTTGSETFLVVGSGVDVQVSPRRARCGYLRTYRLTHDDRVLELLHKTETDAIPVAMHAFHGRLLVAAGPYVRMYEMGTKKLLRKSQTKPFPTTVVSLNVQGARVVVGDLQESVHYMVYKQATNGFTVFADDTLPRYTTCVLMLDYDTVMHADKFGNVAVLRVDTGVSRDADEDPTGLMLQAERPFLMGAAHRLEMLAHFHVGDLVTSLRLASLVPGGRPVVVYTGLNGTVGALIPFISKEDAEVMTQLELHMRQEYDSLVGRDHLSYRGAYIPVKAVVDGDLVELYGQLPHAKQESIAESLDRTPNEINKKLAQLRESTTGY